MKFIFQLDSTLRSQLIKIQISVKERARDKKENGQKAPTSAYVYPLYNGLINISSRLPAYGFFEKGSMNHFEQNLLFRVSTSITEFALKNSLF